MNNQLAFFKIPKSSPKPYVWDGRDDYCLTIFSNSRPVSEVKAGTWSDIKKAANQEARKLKKKGYKNFAVIWEDYPDEMVDKVLTTFFKWENDFA